MNLDRRRTRGYDTKICRELAEPVRGRIATGRRAGQAVLRFGDRVDVERLPGSQGQRCAIVGGVSIHANVSVPSHDRFRLERFDQLNR